MKKDKKERLFEVMQRLDKTFKPKLNEEYMQPDPTIINNILSKVGGHHYKEPAPGVLYGGIDTGSNNAWVEVSYSERKNGFVCSLIFESERMDDLMGRTVTVPMNFDNPEETLAKLTKVFNELQGDNVVDNISEENSKEPFKNLKYEKPTQTIRTVPENYWIASVKDDGEIVFDSWDGAIKGRVDKDYVIDWFNKNVQNVNEEDLNEIINPSYTHFALLKDSKKFVNGWDFSDVDPQDLKQDKMHYFFQDIIDMDINPKNVLVGTAKKFQKEGLDPFNSNNWHKFNT